MKVKGSGQKTVLPVVGDIVTARVETVNQRFAKCSIICINDTLLNRPLRGILRKEDIRATDIDRVEMYMNFRPNDVILAKVIPQVELHQYSLTTAENELGTVIATNRSMSLNHFIPMPMVPVSWKLFQCPITLNLENRKVAKIIMSENALASTNQ